MTSPASLPANVITMFPDLNEIGHAGNLRAAFNYTGRAGVGEVWEVDQAEQNPELRFPQSAQIFERMRKSDGKLGALLKAIRLPIQKATYDLNEEGVQPRVANLVRSNLAMPREGEALKTRPRGHGGVVWTKHLEEVLTSLVFGFMPFEQVAYVTLPGESGHPEGFEDRIAVQLRKLGQRLPHTLETVRVNREGGLEGIVQLPPLGDPNWTMGRQTADQSLMGGRLIPVNRLVMYSVDREGADWYGTSVLRTAYKHWILKDELIRTGATAVERNGVGLPVVYYGPEMTAGDALEIARNVRAGRTAGVAVPAGQAKVELLGVSGSTVDPLPQINYHEQAMSASVLAMFMDLGAQSGSSLNGSLGDTFVEFFVDSMNSVAKTIVDTATEHVIRDLVEWNFGPDEPYPRLTVEDLSVETALSPENLAALTTSGLLTSDLSAENYLRKRFRMPQIKKGDRPDPAEKPEPPQMIAPALPGVDPAAGPDGDKPAGEKPVPPELVAASEAVLTGRMARFAERQAAARG